MISLTHGISDMTQMNPSMKQKWNQGIENRLVVAKQERSGKGMDWEFGISRCKLEIQNR